MRKVLGIISSLVITVTASSTVIACGTNMINDAMPKSNENDNNKVVQTAGHFTWMDDQKTAAIYMKMSKDLNNYPRPLGRDIEIYNVGDNHMPTDKLEMSFNDQDVNRSADWIIISVSSENASLFSEGTRYQINIKNLKVVNEGNQFVVPKKAILK